MTQETEVLKLDLESDHNTVRHLLQGAKIQGVVHTVNTRTRLDRLVLHLDSGQRVAISAERLNLELLKE